MHRYLGGSGIANCALIIPLGGVVVPLGGILILLDVMDIPVYGILIYIFKNHLIIGFWVQKLHFDGIFIFYFFI